MNKHLTDKEMVNDVLASTMPISPSTPVLSAKQPTRSFVQHSADSQQR